MTVVNGLSNMLGVGPMQPRASDPDSNTLEGVRRMVTRTEKMVGMVQKAYQELKLQNSEQLGRVVELQNEVTRYAQDGIEKRYQMHGLREETVQFIDEIKKYTAIVNEKDEEARRTNIRLTDALEECSKQADKLEDARLECERLRLEIEDANRTISVLRRDNC